MRRQSKALRCPRTQFCSLLTRAAPLSARRPRRNNYGIALTDEGNPALANDSVAQLRQAVLAFKRAQAIDPTNEWATQNREDALAPSAKLITRAGVFVTANGLEADPNGDSNETGPEEGKDEL